MLLHVRIPWLTRIKADLGTARREYISTSDIPNKNHRVSQAQVEAQRASNIPGSESHRLAETNQSQLNAWNGMYYLPSSNYSFTCGLTGE